MAQETTSGVVIIGNKAITEQTLSKIDLQNIFLGKITKVGNTRVTFVILKSGAVHESFLKAYLSRTPDQYDKYWKKLIFTGEGKAPKVFATEDALIEYVQSTEGAIGYIGSSAMQARSNERFHQLTIQ